MPRKRKPPGFGPTLHRLREAAGLTRADLAEKAGVDRVTLHRLETSGRCNPSWDVVQKLAAALGVPTDTFRDDTPTS